MLALAVIAGCGQDEARSPGAAGRRPVPPKVIAAHIVPSPAYATSFLTAQVRTADAQGQAVELLYQWLRNGEEIPGATSPTLRPPAFRQGDEISVQVIPRSRGVKGAPVAAPPLRILNSPPAIVRLALSPGFPVKEDAIAVTVEAHDPDDDSLTFSYQWLRNDVPIPHATEATLSGADLRKGDRIAVRVTASDGEAESPVSVSPTVVVRNTPPRVVPGKQWQTGPEGTLIYQVMAVDADGDPVVFRLSSDAPKGMIIDPHSGVLRWTPGPGDAGAHRFSVIVTDSDGAAVQQEVTVTVGAR